MSSLAAVQPAAALEFGLMDGEIGGSFDTTLSYGRVWRTADRDVSRDAADINANDGNRNFDGGLVSEVFKATSEFEARYRSYGAFVRGTAFYDVSIMDRGTDYARNDAALPQPSQNFPDNDRLTDESRHRAGRRADLLDAYVYGSWDIAGHPLGMRLGRQVFNWGESIFFRGGVNTSNPVDASKLRLPGSEVKEVLVPLEAFQFSLGITDSFSVEAYIQSRWEETELESVGTFFSETDLFAPGGHAAYLQNDAFAPALTPSPLFGNRSMYDAAVANPLFGLEGSDYAQGTTAKVAGVGRDIGADDQGQFGIALRYVAERWNATEFGLYFINYHAKEPLTAVDFESGYDGANVAALRLSPFAPAANLIATLDLAGNSLAHREYVENIRMLGFSVNSTIGRASAFAEFAYRPNLPIAIAATNDIVGDLFGQGVSGSTNLYDQNAPSGQACALVAGKQLCREGLFHNYERVESINLSVGTTYSFGTAAGFDLLVATAELASEHLRGTDLSYTAFSGQKRRYAGRQNAAYSAGFGDGEQADRDAYGYTLLVSGTWNDVLAGINLSPVAVFRHDFKGNSHQTGGFIENRRAYTVGLRASYLSTIEAELLYTDFYGAGIHNAMRDRDNIGFNIKYAF